MKKYIFGAAFLLVGLVTPFVYVQAAGLTPSQISAVISLLQAFGADSATIANVNTSLTGGTPTSVGGAQTTPSNAAPATGVVRSFCHDFNTDLSVGNNGDEVSALNQALSTSGIDTMGNTASFAKNNASDVTAFQAKHGIRQTGYVGPLTRAKLNSLYGCRKPILVPPPISFAASPTYGSAPLTVTFKSNTQQGVVDFGDGTSSAPFTCTVANPLETAVSSPTGSTQVCTKEALVCPDGTAVGRTGPNCSFAACPTTPTRPFCSITHSYTAPGTYTATLQTVTQCESSVSSQNGTAINTSCSPVTIGKIAIAVTSVVVPICDYANPPLGCTYVKGKDYNPTNQCGMELQCTDILVPAPSQSTFSASPTYGSAPLTVRFGSKTQQGIVNFGDGTASAPLECSITATVGSSPVCATAHTYTAPGTYTATLQTPSPCATNPVVTNTSSSCNPVTGKVLITVTPSGTTNSGTSSTYY